MSMWARPLSITKMNSTLAWKLFYMEFVNTAIIILLVNSRFETAVGPLGQGAYGDFEFDWYSDVGVGIIITLLINIFSPHLGVVVSALIEKKQRKKSLVGGGGIIPEDVK